MKQIGKPRKLFSNLYREPRSRPGEVIPDISRLSIVDVPPKSIPKEIVAISDIDAILAAIRVKKRVIYVTKEHHTVIETKLKQKRQYIIPHLFYDLPAPEFKIKLLNELLSRLSIEACVSKKWITKKTESEIMSMINTMLNRRILVFRRIDENVVESVKAMRRYQNIRILILTDKLDSSMIDWTIRSDFDCIFGVSPSQLRHHSPTLDLRTISLLTGKFFNFDWIDIRKLDADIGCLDLEPLEIVILHYIFRCLDYDSPKFLSHLVNQDNSPGYYLTPFNVLTHASQRYLPYAQTCIGVLPIEVFQALRTKRIIALQHCDAIRHPEHHLIRVPSYYQDWRFKEFIEAQVMIYVDDSTIIKIRRVNRLGMTRTITMHPEEDPQFLFSPSPPELPAECLNPRFIYCPLDERQPTVNYERSNFEFLPPSHRLSDHTFQLKEKSCESPSRLKNL